MSTVKWKLEDDLCRCCHSEGSFKNLAGAHNFGNEEEIYFDMLRETLDINMAPVPGMLCAPTYTICDACIFRLRDASNFKKQVLECEEKFKEMYRKNAISVVQPGYRVEVKQEPIEGETADFKSDVDMDEEDDDSSKQDDGNADDSILNVEVIKEEIPTRPKRSPPKPKPKPKQKKPAKKVAASKKIATETEKQAQKVEKGGKAPAVRKFRLQDDDYRREGDLYACSRCDKTYDKLYSLKFHVKTKHYKIPRFCCTLCMKEFMTAAPLTVHKLEVHNVDERAKCNACKGMFNTKVQLRKHINNFHMLGEKYRCEFCEYESFSFEGMYKHKFKHKTVKDYHCRFCRKSFLRKTTLDLHERIHTGDRRKVCTVCGQAFVQKASLNYHMTKYHPEVNF